MTDMIDPIHYEDLVKLDPEEICRRTGCSYDPEEKCFSLPVWGDTYRAAPLERTVARLGGQPAGGRGFFELFILHYLLSATEMKPEGTWISEKEIPGGATFFRGPHLLPTDLITDHFGNDLDAFDARCAQLGGTRLEMADAAFEFSITPSVPVAVLYWCGDADFPAEAKLLFDRSIQRLLATDVVYALAVGICERLGR